MGTHGYFVLIEDLMKLLLLFSLDDLRLIIEENLSEDDIELIEGWYTGRKPKDNLNLHNMIISLPKHEIPSSTALSSIIMIFCEDIDSNY